jgi:hypothetical protein
MKFKIGDKVRVRKDLIVNNYYDGVYFNSGMIGYLGKTATVTSDNAEGNSDRYYLDMSGSWVWNDEMLEEIREIIAYKLKDTHKHLLQAAFNIAALHSGCSLDTFHYYLKKEKWGTYKNKLEKAGVLDLWFEPVYKEVRNVRTFTFSEVTVKVTQGEDTIETNHGLINLEDLETILKNIETKQSVGELLGYDVKIPIEVVKIGCQTINVKYIKEIINFAKGE